MKGEIPIFSAIFLAVQTGAADAPAAPVCLDPHRIASTVVLDDSTILFRMSDGKNWKNTLQRRCSGLLAEGAFSYDAAGDGICAGKQIIHVLRRGTDCILGAFEPYVPPPHSP